MIDKFNFYDVYGYFLPGAALLLLLWLPYGVVKNSWPSSDWVSAVLGVVGAYLAGQLLQMICTKAVPSTFTKSVDGRKRYPSAVLLDSGRPPLPDDFKKNLVKVVKAKFELDLVINEESENEDGKRNTAFFLARHVLTEAKENSYGEQFEGMYSLLRGLAASFAISFANYIGWSMSTLRHSWLLDCVVIVVITISLLVGTNLAAHLLRSDVVGQPAEQRLERWTAVVLLLAALGFGYLTGRHFGVTPVKAEELGLCAIGALMACLRSYKAYNYQANNFALTIWRDFYALARKNQPSVDELHV